MPKTINRKCQQCAKVTAEEAKTKSCWNERRCPQTRYYYRNRSKIQQKHHNDRLKFNLDDNNLTAELKEEILAPTDRLKIINFSPAIPEKYTAVLRVYRDTLNSPVRGIDAIIYKGDSKEALVETIDCSRMTSRQIKVYLRRLLEKLHELYEISLFSSIQELSPNNLNCYGSDT